MKHRKILACIAVALIACGAIVYAQTENPVATVDASRVQWEYRVYPDSGSMAFNLNENNQARTTASFVREMNKLGDQGWEIIQIGEEGAILKRIK